MAREEEGTLRVAVIQRVYCGTRSFYVVEKRKGTHKLLPMLPDTRQVFKETDKTRQDIITALKRGGYLVLDLDEIEVDKVEYIRLIKSIKED